MEFYDVNFSYRSRRYVRTLCFVPEQGGGKLIRMECVIRDRTVSRGKSGMIGVFV